MSQGEAAVTAAPADADPGSDSAAQLHRWVRGGKSFSGRERKMCFLNTGETRFADISAVAGLDFPDDARAACLVDWDRDGDVDLWVANRNGPQVRLLRNDGVSDKRFIELRLEGKTCNRDAIGARVEVHLAGEQREPLIRTLRAGDAFLSQSSKWLHFGLGERARIDRVVVRWPNRRVEEFNNVPVDARYVIHEGSGRVQPLAAVHTMPLESAEQPTPVATASARIWLGSRPPMPQLKLVTSGGLPEADRRGAPLLVNLWSASCAACVAELREWSDHAQDLKSAGIEVLVVSVDPLRGDSAGSRSGSPTHALPEPFKFAVASAESIDILQIVNNQLLDQHRPIPTPSSFLIDGKGQLAAVYKGRVAWNVLSADLARLDADAATRRRDSTPFAGRWHGAPREFRPMMLASALAEAGFADEANEYATRVGMPASPDRQYAKLAGRLGNELFRRDDVTGAIARYREALRIDPQLAPVQLNLAVALVRQRDLAAAEVAFREAVRIDPDYANARVQLAALLVQTRRVPEALDHLRSVLRELPNHAAANKALGKIALAAGNLAVAARHFETTKRADNRDAENWGLLAMTYASGGDLAQAAANFEQALRLRPGWPPAVDQLAWILATIDDAKLRDPSRAVKLAEEAVRRSDTPSARALDTLAAAYAAEGRYPDAVRTAENALAVARKSQLKKMESAIQGRLEKYRAEQPILIPPTSKK